MQWNSIKIDEQMAAILDVIRSNNGAATTSDIKEATAFERNNSIKYRLRKLEDGGIVEIENQGIDENGQYLPLKAHLSDEGWELVQEHDIYADSVRRDSEFEERVERLEAKVDRFGDDIWQIKQDLMDIRNQINDRSEDGFDFDE